MLAAPPSQAPATTHRFALSTKEPADAYYYAAVPRRSSLEDTVRRRHAIPYSRGHRFRDLGFRGEEGDFGNAIPPSTRTVFRKR